MVDAPRALADLAALDARIAAAAPGVRVASFASTGDRSFVSDDGRTAFTLVFVPVGQGFAEAPELGAVRGAVAGATVVSAPVLLTGYDELQTGGQGGKGSSALVETLVGGLGALVVWSGS